MSDGFESGVNAKTGCGFSAGWKLGLAGLLALLAGMMVIFQLFPVDEGPFAVIASELGFGGPHRFPKGQLQADAKSLVTSLWWLVKPQAEVQYSTNYPTGEAGTNQPDARQLSQLSGLPADSPRSDQIPLAHGDLISKPLPSAHAGV